MHYRIIVPCKKAVISEINMRGEELLNAEKFESRLLILPLHSDVALDFVISRIFDFFKSKEI